MAIDSAICGGSGGGCVRRRFRAAGRPAGAAPSQRSAAAAAPRRRRGVVGLHRPAPPRQFGLWLVLTPRGSSVRAWKRARGRPVAARAQTSSGGRRRTCSSASSVAKKPWLPVVGQNAMLAAGGAGARWGRGAGRSRHSGWVCGSLGARTAGVIAREGCQRWQLVGGGSAGSTCPMRIFFGLRASFAAQRPGPRIQPPDTPGQPVTNPWA